MYLGARSGDIYFLVFGMCFVLGFGGMWGCVSAVGSGSGFRSGFACVMAAQACAHEWGGGRRGKSVCSLRLVAFYVSWKESHFASLKGRGVIL